MFEIYKNWCERHGYPYKIINNHFYYQTAIQTCEVYLDNNGAHCIKWHIKNFFNEIKES